MQIKFEVQDALDVELEAGSFDVVYSRDTILHIPDKEKLFSNFYVSYVNERSKKIMCNPFLQITPNFFLHQPHLNAFFHL